MRQVAKGLRPAGTIAVLTLLVMAAGGCGLKTSIESLIAPAWAPPQFDFVNPSSTSGCPSAACAAILGEVAAAATTNTIPSDLTPGLQRGALDLRQPPGGDCSPLPIPNLTSDACTFPTAATPTAPMLILMGNSQAWMWSVPVYDIAKRIGYRFGLVYRKSCHLSLAKRSDWFSESTESECRAWQAAASRWLNQQNPAVVLIATGDGPDDAVSTPEDYVAGYVPVVEQMRTPGRKFFMLGAVPTASQDPILCLSAHSSFTLKCATPTSVAAPAKVLESELSAALRAGAGYVNVIPFLCTPYICPAIIGHYLAYLDAYHLTSTYAQTLASVIQQALGLGAVG